MTRGPRDIRGSGVVGVRGEGVAGGLVGAGGVVGAGRASRREARCPFASTGSDISPHCTALSAARQPASKEARCAPCRWRARRSGTAGSVAGETRLGGCGRRGETWAGGCGAASGAASACLPLVAQLGSGCGWRRRPCLTSLRGGAAAACGSEETFGAAPGGGGETAGLRFSGDSFGFGVLLGRGACGRVGDVARRGGDEARTSGRRGPSTRALA